MANDRRASTLVLTVPSGQFVWWRGLEIVDYIPNGHRVASITLNMPGRDNTMRGALRVVGAHIAKNPALFVGQE